MPSKRKADKDGGAKKRKPSAQESANPIPRKKDKDFSKKSKADLPRDAPIPKRAKTHEKVTKSEATDVLVTATIPKKKANTPNTNVSEPDANANGQTIPPQPGHKQAASDQAPEYAALKRDSSGDGSSGSLQNETRESPAAATESATPKQQDGPDSKLGSQVPANDNADHKNASKLVSKGHAFKSKTKSSKVKDSKPLKIDTSKIKPSGVDSSDKGKSPRPPGAAMDTHPYARASVIEVAHGVDNNSDDDWWSEDSDEEIADKSGESVRLCDVIDRVSVGDNIWRYYVHYRDFNRRMDEWISMDRIVSPPSVGNAKARAIKKEKEREQRKKQRLDEKKAEEAIDVLAPRASRRRNSVATHIPGEFASGADGESDTPRRTRLSRKKSVDDITGINSNQSEKSGSGRDTPSEPPVPAMAAEKGVVALPTQAGTLTTTVGEHVVHTITAQELDEHEGLDDAALREHEEVTKVKNVAFLELGAYQMETWYFSPLPKELLSEKGFAEVLYVCEFSFSMFARKAELQRFQARLPTHSRHPPGNEIYRNGNLASK